MMPETGTDSVCVMNTTLCISLFSTILQLRQPPTPEQGLGARHMAHLHLTLMHAHLKRILLLQLPHLDVNSISPAPANMVQCSFDGPCNQLDMPTQSAHAADLIHSGNVCGQRHVAATVPLHHSNREPCCLLSGSREIGRLAIGMLKV